MYEREQVATIQKRISEVDNPLIQVVVGPRQTGKSTMISQALEKLSQPKHFVSADDELAPTPDWIKTEWQQARNLQSRHGQTTILAIDEIQKIKGWPNVVKGLWDADRRNNVNLKIVLSGSSSMLLRRGLEDSLKGRFELIYSPHWSYEECHDAFGFTEDNYLVYGGFPGASRFVDDESRWRAYMRDSIIEPTISKDVLEDEDVRKPALMRALFEMGARFSAQELSYTKMLGQLQDAGNTTTLAHYLNLLDKAGMLTGLERYSENAISMRKSSPRLLVYDTGLMTAVTNKPSALLLGDSDLKGHLVESVVGAHLLSLSVQHGLKLSWWREGIYEVDFVVSQGDLLFAIEVKSGRTKAQGGMNKFLSKYPRAQRIVVGGSAAGSCTLQEFLTDQLDVPWQASK